MLQRSKGPHFPHAGTKFSLCTAAVPTQGPGAAAPLRPAAHRLARKADFHKGIDQVLLVAVEAKDLPDVVHDGIIHCEGKEMLKAHGSARRPDGPGFPGGLSHRAGGASPLSQVGRSRRVKPLCTSKRLISQYITTDRHLQGLWTKAMDKVSLSVPLFLSGTL